jgi:hypothetical protein
MSARELTEPKMQPTICFSHWARPSRLSRGCVSATGWSDLPDQAERGRDVRRGVRRAELARHLALERHRVDGEDASRAGQPRALDGRRAEAAGTDHRHVIAGPHAPGVHRAAPAGRHPAPGEAGDLRRDGRIHRDHRSLVHHGVPGVAAHHAGDRQVLPAGPVPGNMVPGGVVEDLQPVPDGGGQVAEVLPAPGA